MSTIKATKLPKSAPFLAKAFFVGFTPALFATLSGLLQSSSLAEFSIEIVGVSEKWHINLCLSLCIFQVLFLL
ncbi:hypothetical protein [Arcanobacterium phocae]|uniref:hypothetical protein n=1 Tax=Arcanobacterium phocae TaxID=131112 RepID=UPI001560B18E|nr:hypothetical protein [Arcanobacterium phocae]